MKVGTVNALIGRRHSHAEAESRFHRPAAVSSPIGAGVGVMLRICCLVLAFFQTIPTATGPIALFGSAAMAFPSRSSTHSVHGSDDDTRVRGKDRQKDLAKDGKSASNVALMETRQSNAAASRWSFGSILGYSARTDMAQTRDPQIFNHRLSLGGSITLADHPVVRGFDDELAEEIATLSISMAGQYMTIGSEIESNRNGNFELADLDVSLSRSMELQTLWQAKNMIEVAIGSSMPTSVASQYEGVRSIPYFSGTWILSFRGGLLTLTQGLSADYTANSFDFSPTTKEINSDMSAGYSIGGSVRLGGGLKFSVGGSSRLIHHLDGTTTNALNNSQALSWSRGNFTASLRHTNGSRAEDRETDLWFLDQYRNVFSFSLMARF